MIPERELLEHALDGLEASQKAIDQQIAEIQRRLAALKSDRVETVREVVIVDNKPKRTMSAAGRKKIRDAAKKRWAAWRKANKGR